MSTVWLIGWTCLVAGGAFAAPVELAGRMNLPEALERLAATAPEVEYFALTADQQPREVQVSGELPAAMPALAATFGLQAAELLGVWILAPAPAPDTALQPVEFLTNFAAAAPDWLRNETLRMLQSNAAVVGDWNHLAHGLRGDIDGLLLARWQAVANDAGRPATGMLLLPTDLGVDESLRVAVTAEGLQSVIRGLIAAAGGIAFGTPELTLEPLDGGRARLSLTRWSPGSGDLLRLEPASIEVAMEEATAPYGMTFPSRAVLLTQLVTLTGQGSPERYGAALATAARLDGCGLDGGADPCVWRLQRRPVWFALDVQGIARSRVWSPPTDAWTYGDAPVSATSAFFSALPLELRAALWNMERSRRPYWWPAIRCWQALSEGEREALQHEPVALDRLSPAAYQAALLMAKAARLRGSLQAADKQLDGVDKARLFAVLRWWPGSVVADVGQAREWRSQVTSSYLIGPPEPKASLRFREWPGEQQLPSPLGSRQVASW